MCLVHRRQCAISLKQCNTSTVTLHAVPMYTESSEGGGGVQQQTVGVEYFRPFCGLTFSRSFYFWEFLLFFFLRVCTVFAL